MLFRSWALSLVCLLAACGGGGGGGGGGGAAVGVSSSSSSSANVPAAPAAEVWQVKGVALGTGVLPALNSSSLLMPEVVQVSSNLFRLYYGESRADGGWDIKVAESPDGAQFSVKGTVLQGASNKDDPEFILRGASMLKLADGRWRMYYQATPYFIEGPNGVVTTPYFQTMSAISSDGLNFVREGVRMSHRKFDPNSLLTGAGHGRVLQLADGTYVAYVSGAGAPPNTAVGIYICTSADGLTFTSAKFLTGGHDPFVVKMGNSYLMYIDPSMGGAAYTTSALLASNNGLDWGPASTASLKDANGNLASPGPDLGGLVMPDGKLRLYSNFMGSSFAYYTRVSP